MRKRESSLFWRWAAQASVGVLLITGSLGAVRAQPSVGRVLARVQPGESIQEIAREYDARVVGQVAERGVYELRPRTGNQASALAQELSGDVRVQYAEREAQVELPEVHGQPFHMAYDLSSNGTDYINQNAYNQINLGNPAANAPNTATIVAVLDTGVNYTHPALANRLLAGYNTLHPQKLPRDLPDGITNIAVGHGTMIAGIITRAAPHASILPIKALNADGVGTMLNVIQGIHYAVTHGAKIINMSFGSSQSSQALKDALAEAQDAGVVLVASAGNEGANKKHYPAAYEGVLGVASVDANDQRSDFSTYGRFVRLVAPGRGIRSAYWTGGYASWSGTSFAAPFVAAEAAEIAARHPLWNSDSIGERICETAHSIDPQNPGYAGLLGAGLIDVEAALFGGD